MGELTLEKTSETSRGALLTLCGTVGMSPHVTQ